MELALFRDDVTNGGSNVSTQNYYNAIGNNFWNTIPAGAATGKIILLYGSYLQSVDLTGLSDGDAATFDNYTGALGTEINGNTYYVKIYGYAGSPFFGQYGIELYTDSALTTPVSLSSSTGNYGAGTMEWTQAPAVTDREYKFRLQEQSENLEFVTTGAASEEAIVTYEGSTRINIQDDVFLNLGSASNTEILAYSGMSNGDMIYNSTDATVAVYAGGVWQNLQFSGNVS